MPLLSLPHEVIQRVALWAASNEHTLPPGDLLSFALTCRAICEVVLGDDVVLANIARSRYSTSAPLRRLGPAALTNAHAALELTIRISTLRRVRRGIINGGQLIADLWVVFHMCIEDDGHNTEQLEAAHAEQWVTAIIRHRLPYQVDNMLWPLASETAQLAVFIYAVLATRTPMPMTQERDQIIDFLRRYAFAGHRYLVPHLPEALFCVNTQFLRELADLQPQPHTAFGPNGTILLVATTPIAAPIAPPDPLWGHTVLMSLPPVGLSAILALHVGWTGVHRTPPYIDAPDSRRFDPDYWRLVLSHVSVTQRAIWPHIPAHEQAERYAASARSNPAAYPLNPVHGGLPRFLEALTPSPITDARLSMCWFGIGRLWAPGMLTGLWTGGFVFIPFAWYTNMLQLHPVMPGFEFGTELSADPAFKSVLLNIREHVSTDIGAHIGSAPLANVNGLASAWFHQPMTYLGHGAFSFGVGGGGSYMYEQGGQLIIFDAHEPDPDYAYKRYDTVALGEGINHDSGSNYGIGVGYDGYGVACPMPPMEPLPVFPSVFEAREGDDSWYEDWDDDGDGDGDGDSPSTPSSPAHGPTSASSSHTDDSSCHGTDSVPDSVVSEVNRLVDEAMECGPQRARVASPGPGVGGGRGGGDDDEDEDGYSEDDDDNEFLKLDVIITGETQEYDSESPSDNSGLTRGAFRIFGRIRSNDGFVVFVSVPKEPDVGYWVFRGYVVGGALTGRWRETATSFDHAGYEGTFTFTKERS